ncbi:hypothetical protein CF326_g7688 [Tilletia indica]|uniref:Fatty acid hydroxylase domain-containing protein n=1 Tax=Tilletia indica TaxID=43049 RepID=A0A177TLX6_9BASI|nr:hypothetical protein CF326_g7688 [Tilletia indica]KAE8259832.1 hypothetical protein A4X13_0g746 [Tilletia indica]
MDVVLELADEYVLDHVWNATASLAAPWQDTLIGSAIMSSKGVGLGGTVFPRSNLFRQIVSLYSITYAGIFLLYFAFATASYYLIFNHEMMRHPRFLPNQVRREIKASLDAFWVLDWLTLPWFLGEVRGYSKLYHNIDDYGMIYAVLSVPFFLIFTDVCIYWIHRLEHHPRLYKHIHKPHHRWIIPTPFASHAFHPLDGYAQSLPYHIFVYIFPLHRWIYMGLFVFVNLWSILIHDSDMICNTPLENIINGPSHHTLHHIHFNVNYGQYFVWSDRLGGSYRAPKMEDDPMHDVVAEKKQLQRKQQQQVVATAAAAAAAGAAAAALYEKRP